MRIAGKRTVRRWHALRTRLQATPNKRVWMSAFDHFYLERIRTRYLNPIASISAYDTHLGEGFAIVALCCTLIEYLESCEQGDNFRYLGRTGAALGPHEYSERQASVYFKNFLRARSPFSTLVPANLIESFYRDVRCGLLHEARTKGGWTLSTADSKGRLVRQRGTSITLFRNELVRALEDYLQDYRHRLLTNANTQAAFIRKFDYLCSP